MPSYKHPCPYCGKFIDKIAAACPYCGHPDPFAPRRCPNCDKIVEDTAWVACPSCGASLLPPPTPAEGATAPGAPAAETAPAAPAPAPAAAAAPPPATEPIKPTEPAVPAQGAKCSGCGSPLAAGARFCTTCGTTVG